MIDWLRKMYELCIQIFTERNKLHLWLFCSVFSCDIWAINIQQWKQLTFMIPPITKSNLFPLRVSGLPHPFGSFGAPGGHSPLVLLLARWSLCSGPRPDAADRLCCSPSALWDLRIDQAYIVSDRADSREVINQVWQVFNLTNRNYNWLNTNTYGRWVELSRHIHQSSPCNI